MFVFDSRYKKTHTHSDRPIAIAYSPTEPNPSHLADVYRPTPAHHSTPVFVNAANDENLNVNQQFQAPFIPSINLENTQSTHNGWSIVTPPTVPVGGIKTESKSNRISASLINSNATSSSSSSSSSLSSSSSSISRSDSDETAESMASVESTTKRFNFESFKPDFQGGFIPIYKSTVAPSPSASSSIDAVSSTSAPPTSPTSSAEKSAENSVKTKADDKSDDSGISLGSLFYDDDDEEED